MTFFDDVSPFVNWKKKSVHVFQAGKRVQLPVQCYGIKRDVSTVLKSWPGAVVHENPFEVLEVHGVDNDIVHDVDSVPVAAQGRDGCGMKACKCVGGCEQLQHLRNASVQTTHAKGGSVKRVPDQSGTRNNCVSGYKSRVAGKGLGAPAQGTTTNARGCLNCGLCGKRIMHGSICKKCANASFAHFENQLLDQSGSIVDVADVEDDDVSN